MAVAIFSPLIRADVKNERNPWIDVCAAQASVSFTNVQKFVIMIQSVWNDSNFGAVANEEQAVTGGYLEQPLLDTWRQDTRRHGSAQDPARRRSRSRPKSKPTSFG